ncbi:MAG TPA: DNA topoisomerase, partial [Anaerovoracaceae bacterium]|nr:DNA topoisomerase [Anaerovoracaceae bacterium]
MKKLIIAEKPSVAKNIAEALNIKSRSDGYLEGDNYIVTWVFGHLLQLYDVVDYDGTLKGWKLENFPFIPSEFKYKIKSKNNERGVIDAGAQKQVNIIKDLIQRSDVESVISATDYDREGQVIADEIFLYLGIQKPIFRLLLNEWTPDEVLKGLENVCLNIEMKSMQDAGFGRQMADWLIGINLTSVATVKYRNSNNSKVLNIGRVLLPTLKIIYDRDKEIESFESSKY